MHLSPQRLTAGAQEVATLAGVQESFAKAAERTLRKMAGIQSQAMLLAAANADNPEKVVPVEVPGAKIGARLS